MAFGTFPVVSLDNLPDATGWHWEHQYLARCVVRPWVFKIIEVPFEVRTTKPNSFDASTVATLEALRSMPAKAFDAIRPGISSADLSVDVRIDEQSTAFLKLAARYAFIDIRFMLSAEEMMIVVKDDIVVTTLPSHSFVGALEIDNPLGVTWEDNGSMGEFQADVPHFGPVKIMLAPHANGRPGDVVTATLADIEAISESDVTKLRALLWEDCLEAWEAVSYFNDEPDDPSERLAFLKQEFGIFGPDDALLEASLMHIWIAEDDAVEHSFENRYAMFAFDAPWASHLAVAILRNAEFVAVREDGCWLGEFEPQDSD